MQRVLHAKTVHRIQQQPAPQVRQQAAMYCLYGRRRCSSFKAQRSCCTFSACCDEVHVPTAARGRGG